MVAGRGGPAGEAGLGVCCWRSGSWYSGSSAIGTEEILGGKQQELFSTSPGVS